jgi:hypothetical protein
MKQYFKKRPIFVTFLILLTIIPIDSTPILNKNRENDFKRIEKSCSRQKSKLIREYFAKVCIKF